VRLFPLTLLGSWAMSVSWISGFLWIMTNLGNRLDAHSLGASSTFWKSYEIIKKGFSKTDRIIKNILIKDKMQKNQKNCH
jgi:hypothetical protein